MAVPRIVIHLGPLPSLCNYKMASLKITCLRVAPQDTGWTLRPLGFVEEKQMCAGDGVYCRIWGAAVESQCNWGPMSWVMHYIKVLDLVQVSEPVEQVEEVSFFFSSSI